MSRHHYKTANEKLYPDPSLYEPEQVQRRVQEFKTEFPAQQYFLNKQNYTL